MTKKQKMYRQIEKHGLDLLAIYPAAVVRDPVALCKRLHRSEVKASQITRAYCNGVFDAGEDGEKLESALEPILAGVQKVLGAGPAVFINRDPRGYALKIRSEDAKDLDIYRDLGGYGIICPEFGED